MRTILKGGTIVDGDSKEKADLVIEDSRIAGIEESASTAGAGVVDISGCYVMPGIIDTHVHFREPGNTAAADIYSESRAAACGGVTSFFDMPNNNPPAVSADALDFKRSIAARDSMVNYSFYLGATNSNIDEINNADAHRVCGVKVFMGSSTGGMLVDKAAALHSIFSSSRIPIVTHCEDMDIINANAAAARQKYGDDPDVRMHTVIRSAEACYASSSMAVKMAKDTGADLHVAHISTAKELDLFSSQNNKITAEVCIPHLVFCDADYSSKGALIKCNPSVKSAEDRETLRKNLSREGKIYTVSTDHAPHLPEKKRGGAFRAASGMPSVQFSLINTLKLVDEGYIDLEDVARLMANNPARRFNVSRRGFIRDGYYADLTVFRPCAQYMLSARDVVSKCGWTPYAGMKYDWRVEHTFINGVEVYSSKRGLSPESCGQEILFDR